MCRLLYTLASSAFVFQAHAFTVADWLNHEVPEAEPSMQYEGNPVTLKFSSPNPAASLVPEVWSRGFRWLEEATSGKLNIEEYHGGTLHAAADGWRAVRSRVTDYAACYTSYEGSGFPLHKAIELPFVTPSSPVAATRIMQELAPEYFVPEWEGRGVLYGYTVIAGVSDIMSNRPIRTPEDLRGMRVIAQGFPPEAAEALGITTLNTPFPEIYTAFQQGIADAVIWVDPGFVPFKIYELASYHTSLGMTAQHIDTCINREAYEDLPAELKPVFAEFQQNIAHAVSQRLGVEFREEALRTYQENGVELIELTDEEKQAWRAVLEPVLEQWIEAREAEGLPARKLIEDIRRLEAQYEGKSAEELFEITVTEPVPELLPQAE
ncbi:TRAP transporter substrate-binding protein DctP [Chelativorans sp. Marseille-P2723]|uniref:TRAP transporter substrate-binding protein DctP n=1 Tax=Chelativorans sp. Marseille-P2723 TaxID=2709133 RepID=UPI00156FED5D|nr:TRAP transporter substrate-binding protein DctP [Chelativorans sp. Marseille-P2723]